MTLCLIILCDIFVMKSGGRVDGVERGRKDGRITIEVTAGMVEIEEKDVAEVQKGKSKVEEYYERAEKLKESKDVRALWDLAAWARDNRMGRFAGPLFQRILAIDPAHEMAHRALGYERVGDRWMTREEALAERGYVNFEGRWVSPQERDLVLAAREHKRMKAKEAAAKKVEKEETVTYRTTGDRYGFWPEGTPPRTRRPYYRYYEGYGSWPWYYDYQFWHTKVAPGAVVAVDITKLFFVPAGSTGTPGATKGVYQSNYYSGWWTRLGSPQK